MTASPFSRNDLMLEKRQDCIAMLKKYRGNATEGSLPCCEPSRQPLPSRNETSHLKLEAMEFLGDLRARRHLRKLMRQQTGDSWLLSSTLLPSRSRDALSLLLFLLLGKRTRVPRHMFPRQLVPDCQGHRHFHQRSKQVLRILRTTN